MERGDERLGHVEPAAMGPVPMSVLVRYGVVFAATRKLLTCRLSTSNCRRRNEENGEGLCSGIHHSRSR